MEVSLGGGTAGVNVGADSVSVSLENKMTGPIIADYDTNKYDYNVNDQYCGKVFASKKLLMEKGVRNLIESMHRMQQQSAAMGAGSNLMDLCDRGEMQLSEAFASIGAPLRILDAKNQVVSEVLKVETGKKFSSKHFQTPATAKVVNMEQRLGQAAKQTEEMMKDMPDLGGIIEQFGEGGQMTPEMQNKMKKKMEELQKQLQQLQ